MTNFECFLVCWQYYSERQRSRQKDETDRQAYTHQEIKRETENSYGPERGERDARGRGDKRDKKGDWGGRHRTDREGVLEKKDTSRSISIPKNRPLYSFGPLYSFLHFL